MSESTPSADEPELSRVLVSAGHPVIVRGVDAKLLSTIQISNYLRPLTYHFRVGKHVLWLQEPPAGIPFIPQRVSCYTMQVELFVGVSYVLELNTELMLPVLRKANDESPVAVGVIVDQPLLVQRGCKWQ